MTASGLDDMTPASLPTQAVSGAPPDKGKNTNREALDRSAIRRSAPCLNSDALLQGQRSGSIQHNGAVYRLQSTKLGKLILTK